MSWMTFSTVPPLSTREDRAGPRDVLVEVLEGRGGHGQFP
jgi:hypothetical protein